MMKAWQRPGVGEDDDEAQAVALAVFAQLLADAGHSSRFLTATGLAGSDLPAYLGDPAFLGGVLDFVLDDEVMLAGIADSAGLTPETLSAARRRLPGAPVRD